MEIRVRRRLTGRQERQQIFAKYGDRAAVERQAANGDPDAQDALWLLDLLSEDPSRLDEESTVEDVFILDENDLSKLTPMRLSLMETLRALGETNLKDLTTAVGRDQKNVSRDVSILESYGLIESHRHGKEKRLTVAANEIAFAF